MNYSSEITKLEEILKKLEGNALTLEDSLNLFEEGKALIDRCKKHLQSAERKVTVLCETGERAIDQEKEEML